MAIKPFNSVGGFSVAETPVDIVSNVGNVTPTNLDVSGGLSDLGAIGNVTITGGSSGQTILTDGNGTLSFGSPSTDDPIAPMPTLIATGETAEVPANYQGLFGYPITIDGTLEVNGVLVDVSSDSLQVGGANTQIQFNNGTDESMGGSSNLTFDTATDILKVEGITQTGRYSNLALPTSVQGGVIFITNGNNKPAYGDGTNWYYFDNTQVT